MRRLVNIVGGPGRARWAVAVLVALGMSGCFGRCGGDAGAEAPGAQRRSAIQEGYVGSEACRTCHEAETRAWETSAHRTVYREGAKPAWSGGAPAAYEAGDLKVTLVDTLPPAAAGGAPRQAPGMTIESGGVPGTFPVDAVIGGARMEAYGTRLADGALLLLPLHYNTATRAFSDFRAGTCGVEVIGLAGSRVWQSYERVWNHKCIDCHATAGDIGFDAAKQTYATTFVEPGVGCEGCHGPGEAHVAAAKAGRPTEGIVNPARLPGRGPLEACAPCHAIAFPFESRWGGNRPWRPGDAYLEAFIPLLRAGNAAPFTTLAHADHTPASGVMEFQGLAQSRCFLEGNATCTTCHDPHGNGAAAHALKASPRSPDLCATCHAEIVAAGEAHTHHRAGGPGSACVDCHMPPIVKALGTRLASHAIDVPLPVNAADFGSPDACSQCHADRGLAWTVSSWQRLWGSPEDSRRRRLAKALAGEPTGLRALLQDSAESDLLRADAAHALTRAESRGAAPALVAALASDPSLLVRRHAADLLGSLGADPEAEMSVQIRQQEELARTGALDALRKASDSGPAVLRLDAASSLARLGTEDGLTRLEALRGDPVLSGSYRLPAALGRYYLLSQRLEDAAREYERVLELTPNHMTVIKDLGFIYFAQRRFPEARALWLRGLALSPFDEDLQQKIHFADDEIKGEREHAHEGEPAREGEPAAQGNP